MLLYVLISVCGTYQNEKLYDTGCDATMTQSQLAKSGVCLTIFININQKKTVKHTHTYTNRNSNTNTQTNKKINNPTPSYPHKHPSHTKRINENMADAACWEPGRPHSCGVLAPGRLIMCLGRNRNRPSEQTSRSVLRA